MRKYRDGQRKEMRTDRKTGKKSTIQPNNILLIQGDDILGKNLLKKIYQKLKEMFYIS